MSVLTSFKASAPSGPQARLSWVPVPRAQLARPTRRIHADIRAKTKLGLRRTSTKSMATKGSHRKTKEHAAGKTRTTSSLKLTTNTDSEASDRPKRNVTIPTDSATSKRSNQGVEMEADAHISARSFQKEKTADCKVQAKQTRSRSEASRRKRMAGPSFGSASQRFGIISQHPMSWSHVTNKNITRKFTTSETGFCLSPASYNIKRLWEAEAETETDSIQVWDRQVYLERWARMPSVINRQLFEMKKELKRRLGPGTYNIGTEVKKPESTRPLLSSHSTRLHRDSTLRFCTPGPGSYGKGGIPLPQLGEKRSFGIYSSLAKRVCKRSIFHQDSGLAPGYYEVKDGMTEFLKRTVTKRGPYDVFSGERDKPVKMGHRPTVPSTDPNLEYNVVGFECLERLQSKDNKRKGEFLKADQYPARSGERIRYTVLPVPLVHAIKPGPADYSCPALPAGVLTEQKLRSLERLMEKNPEFGFGRATKREFTFQRCSSGAPGPGEYRFERHCTLTRNAKPSSVFAGNVPKLDATKHNLYRHRLRTKNIPAQNRDGHLETFFRYMFESMIQF